MTLIAFCPASEVVTDIGKVLSEKVSDEGFVEPVAAAELYGVEVHREGCGLHRIPVAGQLQRPVVRQGRFGPDVQRRAAHRKSIGPYGEDLRRSPAGQTPQGRRQQQEQYDYLVAHNIQPVGYMPLGSPRRPERDICPEDVADMQTPEMQEIAKAHGVHPALIALKWAHQRGEISIPFSVHNYVSNLKCVTEDPLTEEEMAKIGTLERGNRLVKGQVFLWEGAKDWHDLWDEEGFIVK